MLYLIATPIGNLSDITYRAVNTLKICDYILCEDTRQSQILLNHYDIHKPLKSYHKFNETSRAESILNDLHSGKVIGLISDAGTPGICDPGTALIQLCIENQINVTAIPGPCAAIQAISCSGLMTERFQFWGFLPRKENELKKNLQEILSYPGVTICYESPRRLIHILEMIEPIDKERHIVIAREMTKKFEEIVRGTPSFLLEYWRDKTIKGEIVLLVSPVSKKCDPDWSSWTPLEHVEWFEKVYHLNRKEALKLVAELRSVPKRTIYQQILDENKDSQNFQNDEE